MYTVYFVNFQYMSGTTFETLEQALAHAKLVHFESRIDDKNGQCVAFWSPIGGTRYYFSDKEIATLEET